MKKIFTLLCMLVMIGVTLQARDEKLRVAVFDPNTSGTTISEDVKMAVREIISSTLVNTGNFAVVERALLDKVIKEQSFSNSDMVNENQATELGRLAGATKVVLSVVSMVSGRNMLSIKMIDTETAMVELQKTKIATYNELLDAVEPLMLEMLGEPSELKSASGKVEEKKTTPPRPTPAKGEISIYLEGGFSPMKGDEKFDKYNAGYARFYVFLDGQRIGFGNLKEGCSITVKDTKPGKHKIRLETGLGGGIAFGTDSSTSILSATINKTYKINTTENNLFEFFVDARSVWGNWIYDIIMK